jgi:hypothetical protein
VKSVSYIITIGFYLIEVTFFIVSIASQISYAWTTIKRQIYFVDQAHIQLNKIEDIRKIVYGKNRTNHVYHMEQKSYTTDSFNLFREVP